MPEGPRTSADRDYVNDLELRRRILVRKIQLLMEKDPDVREAGGDFDEMLGMLQPGSSVITDHVLRHAEMTIETLSSICDVSEEEFGQVGVECYLQYRREMEAKASAPVQQAVQPQETRGRLHWLFRFLGR